MSGKTGVKQAEWNSVVNTAENTINSVSEPKEEQLGKTTLNRFKRLMNEQRQINQTLNKFKNASSIDTQKMKKVAENIVTEDHEAANSIHQNTIKVRF